MKRIEIDEDVKALLDKALRSEDVFAKLSSLSSGEPYEPPTVNQVLRTALLAIIETGYDAVGDLVLAEERSDG